jgi:molybdopterin molybdotransferase
VGILVTGEKLMEPGESLPPGKIRNSNSYALYGQVVQAGGEPIEYARVGDDRDALHRAIAKALGESDIVITSGGVSMGDYDFVIEAARDAGVTIHFIGVAQRPGKPMVGGSKGAQLFFGLPGNPAAVMVCFEVYVRPAIRKMLGHENLFRRTITGSFEEPYPKGRGGHSWMWVKVRKVGDAYLLTPSSNQRNDILRSMAFGEGLAEIPADGKLATRDSSILVHLLDETIE